MNEIQKKLFFAAVEACDLDVVKVMIKKYNIVDYEFMMDFFREKAPSNICVEYIADIIDNFYTFLLCLDKTIVLSKDIAKIIHSYLPPRKYYQKLYLTKGPAFLNIPLLIKLFGTKNIHNIVVRYTSSTSYTNSRSYLSILLQNIRLNAIHSLYNKFA